VRGDYLTLFGHAEPMGSFDPARQDASVFRYFGLMVGHTGAVQMLDTCRTKEDNEAIVGSNTMSLAGSSDRVTIRNCRLHPEIRDVPA